MAVVALRAARAGPLEGLKQPVYLTGWNLGPEVLVECEHLELTRPERLAEIWPAISSRVT